VHLRQPLVLNAQLHAPRRVHLDHIDKLPGDGARSQLARKRLQSRSRQNTLENPAEGPTHAHFHLGHSQQVRRSPPLPFQVHIVHADHFPPMNVNDLAIHQVLLQVEEVTLFLERHQGASAAQFQRAGGRLHHILRGHNAQPGARLQHQPGHFAGVRTGGNGNVFEPPTQVPLRIGHRSAKQCSEAYTGCSAWLHQDEFIPSALVCAACVLNWGTGRAASPALHPINAGEFCG